jgi:hypothetical protein
MENLLKLDHLKQNYKQLLFINHINNNLSIVGLGLIVIFV